MRKAKVNPCERKGELLSYCSETSQRKGSRLRYAPCECVKAFRSIRPEDRAPIKYLMNTEEGSEAGETIRANNRSRRQPENTIPVLPCLETFRTAESKGTALYRRLLGERTKFQGCQATEEALIEEKLVRPEIDYQEKLKLNALLREVVPEEELTLAETPPSSFSLNGRREGYEQELKLEVARWTAVRNAHRTVQGLTSPISDYVGTGPLTHRQKVARLLYEEGVFGHSADLTKVVFLVSKNISAPDLVERAFPDLRYETYQRLLPTVNAEIRRRTPEKIRRLRECLDAMTGPQRAALYAVYLNNPEKKNQHEIAASLKISVDSLYDRLKGAKEKLYRAFPEYQPMRRKPVSEERTAARKEKQLVRVIQVNPKTGERRELVVPKTSKGRIRFLEGVDRNYIRWRVRALRPIPYTI